MEDVPEERALKYAGFQQEKKIVSGWVTILWMNQDKVSQSSNFENHRVP